MKGFEGVTISWAGTDYHVAPEGQLMLVAKIEAAFKAATNKQAVTALLDRTGGGPSYAALSMAYGAALRHAGADVSDDEVYLSIQTDMAEQKANVASVVQGAIMALLAIVSPPIINAMNGPSDDDIKKKPKAKKKA